MKKLAVLFLSMLPGCTDGAEPRVYRESNGQVARFSVQQSDERLRIVTFVELQNGKIQDPKLYYYQGHYTVFGVRGVEKPGRMWQNTRRTKLTTLYLPISGTIANYLFLIRRPSVTVTAVDGKEKLLAEWSDWVVHKVPAKNISKESPLVIPPFDEISNDTDFDQAKLAKRLESMYEKARVAAHRKASTPVRSRADVPWYAQ